MSQLPVRRLNNEADIGLGPSGEFFVKKQVRSLDLPPPGTPMTDLTASPAWFVWGLGELGIREIPGKANNDRIMAYRKIGKTPLSGDESRVPWCAIWANAAFEQCGIRGTRSALARSFLDWGQKLDKPALGAVVVLSSARGTWSGHVGFYRGETADQVYLLGGNQNDSVSIAPFDKARIVGIRWPALVRVPRLGAIKIAAGRKGPAVSDF